MLLANMQHLNRNIVMCSFFCYLCERIPASCFLTFTIQVLRHASEMNYAGVGMLNRYTVFLSAMVRGWLIALFPGA